MSFSKLFNIGGSFRRFSDCNDAASCTVDLTIPGVNRHKCIQDIRTKNVTKLKIFTDDVEIISENASYLSCSLKDLKIRSRQNEDLSDDDKDGNGFDWPVVEIPIEITTFSNLKSFSLDNNGKYPDSLIRVLSSLVNLQALCLRNCGLKNFNVDTSYLSQNLTLLDLGHNELSEIPQEIFELKNLECLILTQNAITTISPNVSNHCALTKLDLSFNRIQHLPYELFNLICLTKLYLAGNKIEVLPEQIDKLTRLKHLDLNTNSIRFLPDSIGDLFNLRLLNLTCNKLTALPERICDLEIHDDALLLSGNPLHKPPVEVCIQGKESIKGYFEAGKRGLSVNCKRLKMVLLGETMAGKTSLAKALVEGKAANITEDERTIGLDLYFWRPIPHKEELEILIVDCAGQRKYLLTHQFFFTEGAIFVLVIDLKQYSTSEDYAQYIGYWVNLVIGQVPGAVFQIMPTHLDEFDDLRYAKELCDRIISNLKTEEEERVKELDAEIEKMRMREDSKDNLEKFIFLRRNRPHLPDCCCIQDLGEDCFDAEQFDVEAASDALKIIPVSCKDKLSGLLCLKTEILRIVYSKELCPIVDKQVPDSWKAFEDKVKSLQGKNEIPIVTIDDLLKFSEEFHFTKQMLLAVLSYLDAIGSLAHFKNVQQAKHLVFLDISWLIKRLQLIFRHDLHQKLCFKPNFLRFGVMENQFEQEKELLLQSGTLSKNLLRCIWEDIGDNDDLIENLVEILDHFSIICTLPYSSNAVNEGPKYFITWFLAETMPDNVNEAWQEFNIETEEQLITRYDIALNELPSSIFERFIINVQKKSEEHICASWKYGLFARIGNCRMMCRVTNGRNCSSVTLNGRFPKGHVMEMWETALELWKQFQVLIDEWNGLRYRKSFSICPMCVSKQREKPHLFPVNWADLNHHHYKSMTCNKCLAVVDSMFIIPPHDLLEYLGGSNDDDAIPSDPLTSEEISKVAELIDTHHSRLAISLGLEESDIEAARDNWPHNLYEQANELLIKWKRRKGVADRKTIIEAIGKVNPTSKYKIINYLKKSPK